MAYIPLYQSLLGHKLMIRLRLATGLPVPHLVGHLACLWLWAIDNAKDGVLPGESAIIAEAARWDGDAEAWLAALLQSGFVVLEADGALTIHDWDDYTSNYFDALERHRGKNRERQARYRDRHKGEGETNVIRNVTGNAPKRYVALRNVLNVDQLNQEELSQAERGGDVRASAPPPPAPPAPPRHSTELVGKRPIPADFGLTDDMRDWAAAQTPLVDVETETAKFIATAHDEGKESANWRYAWERWMRSPYAVKDSQARAGPTNGHAGGNRRMAPDDAAEVARQIRRNGRASPPATEAIETSFTLTRKGTP